MKHISITGNDQKNMCQFSDEEDDCRYFFTYEYVENNKVVVEVQKAKGKQKPACFNVSFKIVSISREVTLCSLIVWYQGSLLLPSE